MDVTVVTLALAGLTPERLAALADVLDDAERARAARFAFAEDRRAYVAAHALLRSELSRLAGIAPQEWRFGAMKHGKPYLVAPPCDLRFSLTHTREMVAVALAEGVEVGVDAESSARRADNMKVAARFFAPQEAAFLNSLDDAARRDAFFAIWTLKEAVVKATGEGLTRGLDSFVVSLDPPRMAMPETPDDWRLAHWRLGAHHVALAARCAQWRPTLIQMEPAALLRDLG